MHGYLKWVIFQHIHHAFNGGTGIVALKARSLLELRRERQSLYVCLPDSDENRVTESNSGLSEASRGQTDFSCVMDSDEVGNFHCCVLLWGGVLKHHSAARLTGPFCQQCGTYRHVQAQLITALLWGQSLTMEEEQERTKTLHFQGQETTVLTLEMIGVQQRLARTNLTADLHVMFKSRASA